MPTAWQDAVIFCHFCNLMLISMSTLKSCRKGRLGSGATEMMRSMRTALQRCMQHCQRALAGAAAPNLGKADVVHACADLDIAYYALLEHHLSCGYATPPVPPPHIYFPALARAHPGACSAEGGSPCRAAVRKAVSFNSPCVSVLKHHFSSGSARPSVVPPHDYFPALGARLPRCALCS